jgi:multidrug efflux pump subunit AcrA (membrane-fusion protein)
MRRLLVGLTVLGMLAAAGFGAYRLAGSTTSAISDNTQVVPTTRVKRTPLELLVRMSGELRATRQMMVTAPSTGGQLRILSMAETGEEVEEGDPLMEFDPAEQQFLLEQSRSELLEADQEIIKRQAELEVQAAQDKVTLLTAQFDVRRAELDAKVDATIVSVNDAKIRQVSLEQARRNLAQVEADVKSRLTTTKSALAILTERKMRSTMAADRAQQSIDNLVLKAPMTGVVVIQGNMDMGGEMMIMRGMSMPPYRVGDMVNSGRPLVDVYDIASMEIRARVNEQERANLAVGQSAKITSDAVAGVEQIAKVTSIAGLGRADSRSGPLRQFDVVLMLEKPDPRLRPGTTVTVVAQGEKVDNALVLPRQCVFEKDGKSVVFVKDGTAFATKEVKITHRTESHVAITGIDEHAEVALVDPDKIALPAKPAGAPPAPAPGPVGVGK